MKPTLKPVKWQTNLALFSPTLMETIVDNKEGHYRYPHAVVANAQILVVKPFQHEGQDFFAIYNNSGLFWDKDVDAFCYGQPQFSYPKNTIKFKLFPDIQSVQNELERIVAEYSRKNSKWFLLDIDQFVFLHDLQEYRKERESHV